MNEPKLAGSLRRYNFGQADNVWSLGGISPTILAYNQGQIGHQINILIDYETIGDMGRIQQHDAKSRHLPDGTTSRSMGRG